MALGLRFRTTSLSLGSVFDYFVPDEDMPDEGNPRGFNLVEDIHETHHGNTFLYEKSKLKEWRLSFSDIQTITKEAIEHIAGGWFGKQQVTIVYFGSHVSGTTQSPGTYTASQIWGTGYCRLDGIPRENSFDLWTFGLIIKQFGTNQAFTV